jgi:16S rRNA (uracil1498-N3)-methyltransferase
VSKTRHTATRTVLIPEAARAAEGSALTLAPDKAAHLRKVLRLEWGEAIHATDGQGKLYEATLEREAGGRVRLERLLHAEPRPEPVELVLCLPKNATMDWVVEKAAEVGVGAIRPVVSSRSVVKPSPGEGGKYVRRWQSIIDGAIEQSERLWRPSVEPPEPWEEWIASARGAAPSFAFVSESRERGRDREALASGWEKLRQAGKGPIRVLVGPEGGLSEPERSDLHGAGFEEISLGSAVLRVETAVVSVLTLVRLARTI